MPAETAATPKPWRSPLGEACGPSRSAVAITACTARQPVMRDQGARGGRRGLCHDAPGARGCRAQGRAHRAGQGDGHSAVDPRLALLQGLEHKHAGGEVDTVGGERECFGQAAAGIGQGHAEGAHQAVGTLGFPASRSLAVTYFRAPSAV
jgi:hypothetical protein